MGNAKRTILVNIWDDPDAPNGIQFNLSGYDVQNNEVSCASRFVPVVGSSRGTA